MASGNTLCRFKPQDNEPPSSNYATLDTRNGQLVLEFDPAADEEAIFSDVFPRNYAGGGINVIIIWASDGATSGNVVWGASIERQADETLDIDSDSFASEKTATAAAPATSGFLQYTTIQFTDGAEMDSLAVGESFRIKVRRLGSSSASDTMNSNDAQLKSVTINET